MAEKWSARVAWVSAIVVGCMGSCAPSHQVEAGAPPAPRVEPIAKVRVTPTSGLQVGEDGRRATFTLALTTPPMAPVSIRLYSEEPTQVALSVDEVVFSAGETGPIEVEVRGVDDDRRDGVQ